MKARGDNGQVHPVGRKHTRDLIDVVLIDFARVVVLEAFEQVVETRGDAFGLIHHRLVCHLVMVARWHEARNGGAESPYSNGVLDHRDLLPLVSTAPS